MEISIIVPVYNVEDFLSACIDSILSQSFPDFELILVDDGSPDNCGAICDEYAQKDTRIRVIHQQNGGISAARNAGLDVAMGKYIAFVDSDDVVDRSYIGYMYTSIQAYDADMCIVRYSDFQEHISSINPGIDITVVLSGRDACLHRYSGDKRIHPTAWGKLYRCELFDHLRFPVGKIHEDQYVVSIALYLSKRIAVSEQVLYYYRLRKDSITYSSFSTKHFDNIRLMNSVISYYRAAGDYKLANAAKTHRLKTLALYTVMTKAASLQQPDDCPMNIIWAFYILRKYYGKDKCEWYLSTVAPGMVIWYERAESLILRIRRFVRG